MGGKARDARPRARDFGGKAEQQVAIDDIEDGNAAIGPTTLGYGSRRRCDADRQPALTRRMGARRMGARRMGTRRMGKGELLEGGAHRKGQDRKSTRLNSSH